MNGNNTSSSEGNGQVQPGKKNSTDNSEEAFSDGQFTIKVSQDMTLRNQLRSGLVEALGKNQSQIPLYVSWPNWLDDGIVCLYAKDLHRIIHDTVRKTVNELGETFGVEALSGEGMFDIIQTTEQSQDVTEPPEKIPETPVNASAEPSIGQPSTQSNSDTNSPYSEEPVKSDTPVDTPNSAPGRAKPVTDQDIADQLFNELKKSKKP